MEQPILQVRNLEKYFDTPRGQLHAVGGVSFDVEKGRTLGIVGESGCGKSTTGRCIIRLLEPTDGQVIFEGKDILELSTKELRNMRKDMQIIFQDPYSSLDPRLTVSKLISEPIILNKLITDKKELQTRVLELMEVVGLAERLYHSYPHELDGGRHQRAGIARALAVNPKLIICDEPVSALDVSIQAQILNLLKDLQSKLGLIYIFITHDLSVIYYFADDIVVMYLGELIEKAPAEELFSNPLHPYTRALLNAIPVFDIDRAKEEKTLIKGEISSPINLKDECCFLNRCDCASDQCRQKNPELREVSPKHFLACYHPLEKAENR